MSTNNRILVVFENGVYKGRASQNESLKFLSISVGASSLEISEDSGKFDFGAKVLGNVAAGTAAGQVLVYDQRGAANGVAALDGAGKVPVSQLPNSIMEFQGVWNASTNSPSLADGTGDIGDVYRVNVAGTQNLGSGAQVFVVGDWVMYNGSIWQLAHSGADVVQSVNGYAGVIVLNTDDIAEGTTNKYWTQARFDTAFAAKSTTDLAEGSNLYYTQARFDTAFAAKSTSDLAEGSNLYFTDARARTAVVDDAIVDGVTNKAPSQNAVFDALALKADAVDVQPLARSFTNDNASAITVRKVVFVKSNGNVDLADKSSVPNAKLAIVKDASIASAASGMFFYKDGTIISGFSGLTPGANQYVGVSGAITETAPSASGEKVYLVGQAISATEIEFAPEFIIEIV